MATIRLLAVAACLLALHTVAASTLASGFPHTTDTLSEARYSFAATALGDKAFFAGGFFRDAAGTGYDSHIVDIYTIPDAVPGDADRDGGVDLDDLFIVRNNYGGPGGWGEGDFSGDGVVSH